MQFAKKFRKGFTLEESSTLKTKTLSGLMWTFMERIGAQGVSFIVSLVLARLLLPEQYGIIALVTVIINICDVFVSSSFSNALIQKKDADDKDFSTVLYFNIVFSIGLYALLFFVAPLISSFFEYDQLTWVIRVMGLKLIIASVNSVQKAMVSRKMQFKKFFWATFGGTIVSAIVGIIMAMKGYGVWSLVAQYLVNSFIDTVILAIVIKWIPKLRFSFKRLGKLLSYGWKVLLAALINVIYEDIRTLIIGKMYTEADLAYYNQGRRIPNLLVANINTSIQSVMFPIMANKQDDKDGVKRIVRRSMKTSAFIIMPMMFGLAAVAEPLIKIVLTDNWLGCVPYLQILCINFALLPLQTANLQAIYALGRSDIALRLEIIKRVFNLVLVLVSCQFGVFAIAASSVIGAVFCSVVNAFPNKKLLKYGYFEQIKDILPFIAMSAVMAGAVIGIGFIPINIYIKLVIQVLVGVVIYVALSAIFKVESFRYILNIIKPYLFKITKKIKELVSPKVQPRDKKMDFIKGLLMISVLLGHFITAYTDGANVDSLWIHTFVRTFDMPLFMLISGLFLRRTIDKYSWWKNIINKISAIGIPLVLWQTVFFAMKKGISLVRGNFSFSIKEYIGYILGSSWFLWSALICTITVIIVHKFLKNEKLRALLLAVLCISLHFIPNVKYNISYMLPFFVIGYFFDLFYIKIKGANLKAIKIMSFVCFALLLCLWDGKYNVWNAGSYILEDTIFTTYAVILRFAIGLIGCVVMTVVFEWLFDAKNSVSEWLVEQITNCGQNTLMLYLFQGFAVEYLFARAISVFNRIVGTNIFVTSRWALGWVIAPLSAFITMIALNAIIESLKKTPKIGKYLFGFKLINRKKK